MTGGHRPFLKTGFVYLGSKKWSKPVDGSQKEALLQEANSWISSGSAENTGKSKTLSRKDWVKKLALT